MLFKRTTETDKRITISVAKDFSRFPGGRYKTDGPNSAEFLRDDIIIPALKDGYIVTMELDGVMGYASSFLEEVFGGLVRKGYSVLELQRSLILQTTDGALLQEIQSYILDSFVNS